MKKDKYPQTVTYPSRINCLVLDRANLRRKEDRITWPSLTEKLLKLYTKKGMSLFY